MTQLTQIKDPVDRLGFSDDGSRIAAEIGQHTIGVWDTHSGRRLASLSISRSGLGSSSLNRDGSRVLVMDGSLNGPPIQLFDTSTSKRIAVVGELPRLPKPQGWIVSGPAGGTLKWDIVSGDPGTAPSSAAFSPDGKWFAHGELTRPGVWLRDSATGSLVLALAGTDPVEKIQFTPDGQRLAAANGSRITLWNPGHSDAMLSIPCSADFAIGADGLVCVPKDSAGWLVRVVDNHSSHYPGAEKLVEELFGQYFLASEVVSALEKDRTLEKGLREAAIAEAERHADDKDGLYGWSNDVLARPDAGIATYRLAAKRLHAVDAEVEKPVIWAAAQYRLHNYATSLGALSQSNDNDAEGIAFLAMTNQRIGKHSEALQQLERLKRIISAGQPETTILGRLRTEAQNVIH